MNGEAPFRPRHNDRPIKHSPSDSKLIVSTADVARLNPGRRQLIPNCRAQQRTAVIREALTNRCRQSAVGSSLHCTLLYNLHMVRLRKKIPRSRLEIGETIQVLFLQLQSASRQQSGRPIESCDLFSRAQTRLPHCVATSAPRCASGRPYQVITMVHPWKRRI